MGENTWKGSVAVLAYFLYSEGMKIGVYGMGRFGSFWASLLASHGHEVYGYTRHAVSVPPGVSLVGEDEILGQENLFLCVPISAFKDVVTNISPRLTPATTVFDTCSVKLYPYAVMEELLVSRGIPCIATHPMFGPDSGAHGVKDLPMMLSSVASSADIGPWEKEFSSWGLTVLHMNCDTHDKETAWSQGVTHFVGRTLDELHLGHTDLATTGYRRLMSIVEQTCNDPRQLFYDLQRYNPYASDMRRHLRQALDKVMAELVAQDMAVRMEKT
ncbi:prephenate dehydrogenase/arogenate dehydrogenase family protein [Parasphaerochaeta coccoides]|uniref:Prephenate dehydrogenase n=1 Tax=Parasphaerochaeta coccoides (strain ATCC BAA-1237 / DSM 17374 / SPN1) TaxID=760011 RepID=F4GJG8_PARC1|nr:prephenate dehydrogenase/arogenate dehydrogenase family protein [Parasphaerochaeta coccoides]AEC02233.1 Prephenate dehydrogenase [Parasphaerochaeta coccoides DSM 17374]